MKERILTCIVCPRGCSLTARLGDDGSVISVSGGACKRGASYAEKECTHPVRTVTSTVRCADGRLIAVKTSVPVPKEMMLSVMREINSCLSPEGVKIGDVVIKNVFGTEADIIATSNGN